jgi:arsenite methyltransferase
LPSGAQDFDVVVLHTTLTHVPEPEQALSEACRVLRSVGTMAVCDGDYSTISVANGEWDSLQGCVEAAKGAFIHDPCFTRRMPALLRTAGFCLVESKSHGYLQISEPEYITSPIDRGAENLLTINRHRLLILCVAEGRSTAPRCRW